MMWAQAISAGGLLAGGIKDVSSGESREAFLDGLKNSGIKFTFIGGAEKYKTGPLTLSVTPYQNGHSIGPLINREHIAENEEPLLAMAYERNIHFMVFNKFIVAHTPEFPAFERMAAPKDVKQYFYKDSSDALAFIRSYDPLKEFDSEETYRQFYQQAFSYAVSGIKMQNPRLLEYAVRSADRGIDMGEDENGFRYSQANNTQVHLYIIKLAALKLASAYSAEHQKAFREFYASLEQLFSRPSNGGANGRNILDAMLSEMHANIIRSLY